MESKKMNTTETLYELCSSGRSGALFYYTKDRKYMLKSIAGREFYKLQSILKDYV
jgi:Phosphatidylinositol-4-phosphate 5-Kinase